MLLGREAELAEVDRLATDVLAGRGRALVVLGEAGIGKTALLDALAERCGSGGLVLRARGVETEAELAFSGLSDLLRPVLDARTQLPRTQAAALEGALALGPPRPGERLALCLATLGLLRAAAGERPLAVIVDDLQWLDASSRDCIAFAARRAGGRVAVAL